MSRRHQFLRHRLLAAFAESETHRLDDEWEPLAIVLDDVVDIGGGGVVGVDPDLVDDVVEVVAVVDPDLVGDVVEVVAVVDPDLVGDVVEVVAVVDDDLGVDLDLDDDLHVVSFHFLAAIAAHLGLRQATCNSLISHETRSQPPKRNIIIPLFTNKDLISCLHLLVNDTLSDKEFFTQLVNKS